MMWLLAAMIGGLIFGAESVLLLPLAYVASLKRKDWGLAMYFIFGILLMDEVSVKDTISYSAFRVFLILLLPSLMALRELMSGNRIVIPANLRGLSLKDVFPGILLTMGAVYEPLFLAGEVLLLFETFHGKFRTSVVYLFLPLSLLYVLLAIIKTQWGELYTPETQVALMAAFSIFLVLWRWRSRKRVDFKLF